MSAGVLSIGTELTRGELVNTNASWLADQLTLLGLEVTELLTVDDDPGRIQNALRELGRAHDLVVCTGGLGPTTDDLTSESVAALLGVPLERDEASLAAIEERMRRFGRTMAASNRKQADFPRGASILPNPKGTAPGFCVKIGQALAFFMPGVPREMKAMFTSHVVPQAGPLVGDKMFQVRLKTFGMTESGVNDKLAGVEEAHAVQIGYRAHFPEIEVKLLARASDAAEAERRARAAAEAVRERLSTDVVYGEGEDTFAESVGRLLVERGKLLALAESCTGGLVSQLLTARSGASAFLLGSAVTYANSAKAGLLGVDTALLEEHGAVSEPVARAMAEGALVRFGADISLALTGVAGPTGGTQEKPVGLVHTAVATKQGALTRQMVYPGSRQQVQHLAAFAGLSLVRKVLLHGLD